MGRYIAKLAEDVYVDWSTVVDSPISFTHTRSEAIREWGADRVARADENGTSILDGYPAGNTPEEIVSGNRAGPRETEITVDEIIAAYDSKSPAAWTLA